jgi:hypothetical protein
MAFDLSQFERNRSSTVVEQGHVMGQFDACDLPPTSWVRNNWYLIPRLPLRSSLGFTLSPATQVLDQGFTPSPAPQVLNPPFTLRL